MCVFWLCYSGQRSAQRLSRALLLALALQCLVGLARAQRNSGQSTAEAQCLQSYRKWPTQVYGVSEGVRSLSRMSFAPPGRKKRKSLFYNMEREFSPTQKKDKSSFCLSARTYVQSLTAKRQMMPSCDAFERRLHHPDSISPVADQQVQRKYRMRYGPQTIVPR